jgi:hypothetical protein
MRKCKIYNKGGNIKIYNSTKFIILLFISFSNDKGKV